MNDLLEKYFTEEEFNDVKNNKKQFIHKVIATKTIKQWHQPPKTKLYPGGELIDIEDDKKSVEDSVTLMKKHSVNINTPLKNIWIIVVNIDKTGWIGTSGNPEFEIINGFTKLNDWISEIYYGCGDDYGKLIPLSLTTDKYVKIGDVYRHIDSNGYIYVRELSYDNSFVCEKWNFHGFHIGFSGTDGISKDVEKGYDIYLRYTTKTSDGDPIYRGDTILSENKIKNISFFFKHQENSTKMQDYFSL